MKALVTRRTMRAMILMLASTVTGCVVGGGYDSGASVDYGIGFYEPYGYEYGGWGPGYGVGPPRRGYDRGDRGHGHAAPHPAYRPAAPSRPMPSLPSHSRGR